MDQRIESLEFALMLCCSAIGLVTGALIVALFYVRSLVWKVRAMEAGAGDLSRRVRVLERDEGINVNWHHGQSAFPPPPGGHL